MELKLDGLTAEAVERVRLWRNDFRASLRTPFPLTAEMQADFYRNVVCNRNSHDRYFGLYDCHGVLVGMGGLIGIQWENGLAEISLIINPDEGGKGYGSQAVDLLLEEGFDRMNLHTIWGECYGCSPAFGFWQKVCSRHGAYMTNLPNRKWWDGRFWDALYFSFSKEGDGCTHRTRLTLRQEHGET